MDSQSKSVAVVGVDTGGTFTDFVFVDDSGRITATKLPSSPADPSAPVIQGLGSSCSPIHRVVHGTTVATNALLERKVAPAALITTAGFEDVLEIGRQNRPILYDLHPRKAQPLIPRELRFGVKERMFHDGTIGVPLDRNEVQEILETIRDSGITSIAVCLLHSYANPVHEETIGEMAQSLGFSVSLSSEILPEFREYERTASVVVNACLKPVMEHYIDRLQARMDGVGLSIMQSAGGVIPARIAARRPVHTVLSGPAGGVIAAARIAARTGIDRLITFDMGGTSTDVSLYDRGPSLTGDRVIAGHPIRVPMMDIHTVGAGGGSIAFKDAGGALRVGPVSAGADPGPVCYGRGSAITVTDANLFLGRIDPAFFLGGKMKVYPEKVPKHMDALARSLELDAPATAEGVITVVNSVMERALRIISVERGRDPRELTLVSFGGAGGLHAADLAAAMGIPRVIVPLDAGVFSAYGMALADVVRDLSRTILRHADEESFVLVARVRDEMIDEGAKELSEEGIEEGLSALCSLDMRYHGQSYEITVPLSHDPVATFHEAHAALYGYSREDSAVQIVTVRVRLVAQRGGTTDKWERVGQPADRPAAYREQRLVYEGKEVTARVFDRSALRPGHILEGPALAAESSSTTFLPPGVRGEVDAYGNLILTRTTERS